MYWPKVFFFPALSLSDHAESYFFKNPFLPSLNYRGNARDQKSPI
jgi:hypothetical protein